MNQHIDDVHMALIKSLVENEALKLEIKKYNHKLAHLYIEVHDLVRKIRSQTLHIENLKKLLPKKEKEEPLPLNLTEIFDDTFHVNY